MPNDNTHALLPCPFCGADNPRPVDSIESWVECRKCHARTGFKNGRRDAAEAWNTRTPADPKAGDWEKELGDKSWTPSAGAQSRAVWLSVAKDILRRALSSAAPRITENQDDK